MAMNCQHRSGPVATPAILIGRQSLSGTPHGASTVLLGLTSAGSLAVFQMGSPALPCVSSFHAAASMLPLLLPGKGFRCGSPHTRRSVYGYTACL